MLNVIRFVFMLVFALATLVPSATVSAKDKDPVILAAFATDTTLTINGTNLALGKVRVSVGAFGPLTVMTQSPTQIVATLPPALPPGNYVLHVQIGDDVDEANLTVGAIGPQGPAGATGAQGPTGATGAAGANGQTGATGAPGPAGVAGVAGSLGLQGVKGDVGAVGQTGAIGPQGPVGAQGLTGAIGTTGAQGVVGATGAVGAQGLPGLKGDTGAQGSQALPGPQGAQGDAGIAGASGLKGDRGDRGDTGPKGDTGPAGPAGSSNLTLATPIFTVNPVCASGGVITLMGTCSYTLAATVTGRTGTGCPVPGAINLITLTYTTPASCAAQCAGTLAPRSACVSQSQVCPGVCTSFYTRDCLIAQPACTGTGTVNDLACNCDNVELGNLVK